MAFKNSNLKKKQVDVDKTRRHFKGFIEIAPFDFVRDLL